MSSVTEMVARMESDIALHQEDIAHLERLVRIAKLATGPQDVGRVLPLLNDDKSSWEETRNYIKTLKERTDDIFFTWLLAARLEHIETYGDKK